MLTFGLAEFIFSEIPHSSSDQFAQLPFENNGIIFYIYNFFPLKSVCLHFCG